MGGWLVAWLLACLVACLVAWLLAWLVGWLVGWLVVWRTSGGEGQLKGPGLVLLGEDKAGPRDMLVGGLGLRFPRIVLVLG